MRTDITGRGAMDLVFPSTGKPMRGTYTVKPPGAIMAGYEARNVVAKGRIDGRLVRVEAAGAAYGGQATAEGHGQGGSSVTLDLEGRAAERRSAQPAAAAERAWSAERSSVQLHARRTRSSAVG